MGVYIPLPMDWKIEEKLQRKEGRKGGRERGGRKEAEMDISSILID